MVKKKKNIKSFYPSDTLNRQIALSTTGETGPQPCRMDVSNINGTYLFLKSSFLRKAVM